MGRIFLSTHFSRPPLNIAVMQPSHSLWFALEPYPSSDIFLLLQLSMWDLLYGQGVNSGNSVDASVVELAISCVLYMFTSTDISHVLWFARLYGPSNRASRTSAYNFCKALSPSDVTKRRPTSVIPTICAGAIFLGVKYIGSRIQRIDWFMEYQAQILCFCLCDRSLN